MTPTNVMVYSAAGGNAGDDAIFYAVRDRLARLLPGAGVTVACPDASRLSVRPGDRAVAPFDQLATFFPGRSWLRPARRRAAQTLTALREAGLVVVGGGGLFNDMFGLRWLSQWVAAAVIGCRLGIPVVLHGVGVGPLRSQAARQMVRWAARSATAITVRDRYSADWLTRIGITPWRIRTTADPVFGLRWESGTPTSGDESGWVGIVPRFDGPDGTAALDGYRALAARLAAAGWEVRMLPLSRHDSKYVLSNGSACWRTVEGVDNPLAYLCAIKGAAAVISTRMHGCLLAAVAGIPVVPVATYDPKVKSIASRLGVPHLEAPTVGQLRPDQLLGAIRYWGSNGVARARLAERVEALRCEADTEDEVLRQICGVPRYAGGVHQRQHG